MSPFLVFDPVSFFLLCRTLTQEFLKNSHENAALPYMCTCLKPCHVFLQSGLAEKRSVNGKWDSLGGGGENDTQIFIYRSKAAWEMLEKYNTRAVTAELSCSQAEEVFSGVNHSNMNPWLIILGVIVCRGGGEKHFMFTFRDSVWRHFKERRRIHYAQQKLFFLSRWRGPPSPPTASLSRASVDLSHNKLGTAAAHQPSEQFIRSQMNFTVSCLMIKCIKLY